MKKITCVLAILAAASTAAVAKDLKQDRNAPAPTVTATQMSDADMDKVTGAGTVSIDNQGVTGSINTGQNPSGQLTILHTGRPVCVGPSCQ
jgi:hypothetical protein